MSDYYEVLGVTRTASFEEIKRAFRAKAKESHPDYHPNDPKAAERFKLVNEAYETLKDPQKKAAYDRYGHDAYTQGMNGGGFGGGFEGFNFGGGGFEGIFDEIFSGFTGRSRTRASHEQPGEDERFDLTITLEEAYTGLKKKIKTRCYAPCSTCHGKGGDGIETCSTCQGTGRLHNRQGFFVVETECPTCQGTGKKIKTPCSDCRGTGRVVKTKELEVNIPKGVDTGVRMRLSGEGHAGLHGGPAGDLYVFLTVEPHPFFDRRGNDLYAIVPVSMTLAALGGEIPLTLIDGTEETIKVSPGTQTGETMRLKGKGMPVLKSGQYGDLILSFLVQTPTDLSPEQKNLLRAFEDAYLKTHKTSSSTPIKEEDFFDKLKGIYKKITE